LCTADTNDELLVIGGQVSVIGVEQRFEHDVSDTSSN
jgi:hypothetical protein